MMFCTYSKFTGYNFTQMTTLLFQPVGNVIIPRTSMNVTIILCCQFVCTEPIIMLHVLYTAEFSLHFKFHRGVWLNHVFLLKF